MTVSKQVRALQFAHVPTSPVTKPRLPLLAQLNRFLDEPAKLHQFANRRLLRRATARAQRRAGIYVRG